MNILFDINHPAHVHMFRYVIQKLKAKGHKVFVTTKNIPAANQLMDIFGIEYTVLGNKHDSLFRKKLDQIEFDIRLWKYVVKHHIDIGIHGMTVAHVSKLSRMKSIITDDDDDEVEPLFAKFAHPFADVVLSPIGTSRKTKNVQFVPSYHELAYLHPNLFEPNYEVLNEIGVEKGERFFVLRFNAFKAHHDVGVVGLTLENKRRLVEMLTKYGKVFITTERDIDEEFESYKLKISPEKAHSLLYFATMFVGDSQTMTSEAAVLGTPAIRCNTFVGKIHYLEDEEHNYGLTYGFQPENIEQMFSKIEELLSMPNLKEEWQKRRMKLLDDKIDYAEFLTNFIENYPTKK